MIRQIMKPISRRSNQCDGSTRPFRRCCEALIHSLGGSPPASPTKFPQSPVLLLLLAEYEKSNDDSVAQALTQTLDAIAYGGIQDHLAGGFHRYSTTPDWSVPHFEKMLYDNAQLLRVYAQAHAIFGNPLYKHTAINIAHYLRTRMMAPGGLISFDSVHNRLIEQHPKVLPRLYQPFLIDSQREHAPDDRLTSSVPVFEFDGQALRTRLASSVIRQGYAIEDVEIDDDTSAAIAALDAVTESDGLGKAFDFAQGQIQIVNNRRIGHRRTGYTDWPEPARKRHLMRIWLRNHGRSFYMG